MARRVGLAGTVMQCAWEEDRATAPTLSGLPAPRWGKEDSVVPSPSEQAPKLKRGLET